MRLEYFHDNNGYLFYLPFRNLAMAKNPGYYSGGFADVTAKPYGRGLGQGIGTSGDRLGQFYGGCDAVFRF